MKKNYLFTKLKMQAAFLVLLSAVAGTSFAQTYSFTPAGATGTAGPTQALVNSAYASTNLNGLVTSLNGKQSFTITTTGNYQVQAYGAKGGNSRGNNYTGGNGSYVSTEVNLSAGDVIEVIAGQLGTNGNGNGTQWFPGGGGGGGSFVRVNGLIVAAAGGGGGAGCGDYGANGFNGNPATAITSGASANGTPAANSNGAAGSSGNGGTNGTWWSGAGGAGYLTNGTSGGGGSFGSAGLSYGNAGTGGAGGVLAGAISGSGGFGGGSGAAFGGGGGGGYSGGAGGSAGGQLDATGGGGGGCYAAGSNTLATAGTNNGDGKVILTSLCNVQINGPMSICAGGSTTLTSTAVSNVAWSTGSNAQSIILNPPVTTQYTVTGTGSQNNCNSVIVFSVVVNPLPVVNVVVSPSLLCVGSTASVTATGANTYTWSSGPSGSLTTLSPVVTTTYSVAGTSTAGCVTSSIFNVDVNTLQLTVTGSTAVCTGKSASLTGSGGTNLAWTGFGPFPTINPTPTVTTVYTLTGIDANNCLLQQPVTVIVNQNPTVTATTAATLVCKGLPVTITAGGATTYSWSASAGSANTAVVTVTPALNTTYAYSVTGTDANGCTGVKTLSIKADLCQGLNEVSHSALAVSVYPNPNNGQFTIKAGAGTVLNIINQLGQIVNTSIVPENGEVSVKGMAKGIYFVVAENNGLSVTKKLVVD